MMALSFHQSIKNFVKKTDASMSDIVSASAIELFTNVVIGTPVRDGYAKGGWKVTFTTPSVKVVERQDPTGSKAINEINTKIDGSGRDEFFLTNNLPYIERLEYGYSDQAPEGMVRISVAKWDSIVKRNARLYGN